MSLATAERAAICDTFDVLGPDRATLCAGWNTADLLAHLLVRERQPAAAAGIVIGPLAGVTEHAMRGYATTPWADRVKLLRSGPPLWSPFRVPAFDRLGNGGELFVHHEDVRRGEPGWAPAAARCGARRRAVVAARRMGEDALPEQPGRRRAGAGRRGSGSSPSRPTGR